MLEDDGRSEAEGGRGFCGLAAVRGGLGQQGADLVDVFVAVLVVIGVLRAHIADDRQLLGTERLSSAEDAQGTMASVTVNARAAGQVSAFTA